MTPKAALTRKTGGRELQCCVIKPTSSVTSSELIETTSGEVIPTRVGKLPFLPAVVNFAVGWRLRLEWHDSDSLDTPTPNNVQSHRAIQQYQKLGWH